MLNPRGDNLTPDRDYLSPLYTVRHCTRWQIHNRDRGSKHQSIYASALLVVCLLLSNHSQANSSRAYEEELKLLSKLKDPDIQDTGILASQIAELYSKAGNLEKANTFADRSRSLLKSHPHFLKELDFNLASLLTNQAGYFRRDGQMDEAYHRAKSASVLLTRQLDTPHKEDALNQLNDLMNFLKEAPDDQKLLSLAAANCRTLIQHRDPRYRDNYQYLLALVDIERRRWNFAEAERLLSQAERILVRQGRRNDLPDLLTNKKSLYREQRDPARLLTLARQCAQLEQKLGYFPSNNLAVLLETRAECYRQLKKFEGSADVYWRAIEIREQMPPGEPNNLSIVVASLNCILDCYDKLNKTPQEVLPVWQKMIEVWERLAAQEGQKPVPAYKYWQFAGVLLRNDRKAEAAAMYKKYLRLARRDDHALRDSNRAHALYNLATIARSNKDNATVEKYFQSALAIAEQSQIPLQAHIKQMLLAYPHLLESQGRKHDAARIRARIEQLRFVDQLDKKDSTKDTRDLPQE